MNHVGWPKLVIRYATDAAAVAALLPPGLEPVAGEAGRTVQLSVYCAPVQGEPELGVGVRIPAAWQGVAGQYTLGMGIDQESAIFISRETNGQPKYPCQVRYFRLDDRVVASACHQGTTFLAYEGRIGEDLPVTGEAVEEHEWWIKASRAVGSTGAEVAYDLPPMVVDVRTVGTVTQRQALHGELELRSSAWDPVADLLPVWGEPAAELVSTRFTARSMTPAGPLDPEGFWPFADTIGGSRWPGDRGGPRRG